MPHRTRLSLLSSLYLWAESIAALASSTTPRRLVIAHDPEVAERRTQARNKAITELLALGEQWGGKLDAQDVGARRRGRPLSDSGAKARFHHAVKDANLAHLIKVDLQAEAFSFTIDEDKQRCLELKLKLPRFRGHFLSQ